MTDAPDVGATPTALARRPALVSAVSLSLVALIAVGDHLTGYDIRLAILYLVPIAMSTWMLGGMAGTLVSITAAFCWLVTFQSSHPYSNSFYFYWEGAITVATFLIITALLARLRRALERSDERFVTVLEELDAAVCVEDREQGGILFGNRRFRERFEGRPLPGNVGEAAWAGELYDGLARRWYLVREREIRWLDGRPALLRILADITDLKQAVEGQRRHRDALDRSSRLIVMGELGSALAHEINQPLAAIATYLDTCMRLVRGTGNTNEIIGAMEKCRAQAGRAGRIVHRLHDFLRNRRTSREPADLNAIVRSAVRLVQNEAAESGVAVDLELAPDLPSALADPLLVEQVLLNLLRNGIEAMHASPVARRRLVVRSAAAADGTIVVTVADLGPGISPDAVDKLYDPFFTTKPSGLGLGLGICRSIVEAHGGRMWDERESADGATFHFSLPVLRQ